MSKTGAWLWHIALSVIASAKQPDHCEITTLFGVTALMIIAAAAIRSVYNLSQGPIRQAELATDLSAGALSIALTVPLAVFCDQGHFVPIPHQSIDWIYVVPLIQILVLQMSSRVLSDVSGAEADIYSVTNRTQAMATVIIAVCSLAIASAFVATHAACRPHF
jgi:K+ transporter